MEEYFDLYNAKKEKIQILRRGEIIPEGLYHYIVSVMVVNHKGELFMTKRAEGKSYAGQWETTAGSVLAGENLRDAAVRELREETGIICKAEELVDLGQMGTTSGDAIMQTYFLEKDVSLSQVILQEGETSDARLVPFSFDLINEPDIAHPVKIRLLFYFQQLETFIHRKNRLSPWLSWAKELQSIAQAGLEYSKDVFDLERFERLRLLASEMVAFKTGISPQKVLGLFGSDKGYLTPKVSARAAVFDEGRILLVKERLNGLWSLPGGWCEPGLSLAENVEKECLEEAGIKVKVQKLIAILNRNAYDDYPSFPHEVYECFFLCENLGGEFVKNSETLESGFFAEDALPPLSLNQTNERLVHMCFEAQKNPNQQTKFD